MRSNTSRAALGRGLRLALCIPLLTQSLLLITFNAAPASAQKRVGSAKPRPEQGESPLELRRPAPAPRPAAPSIKKATPERRKAAPAPTQQQPAPTPPEPEAGAQLPSVRMKPLGRFRLDLKALALKAARSPKFREPETVREIHAPLTIPESGPKAAPETFAPQAAPAPSDYVGPSAPSPAPSANYIAQEDSPQTGTSTFVIPPDTMGAVGLDKVFVNLNNNYRVQNKATGAPLSTVSINTFWAATGAAGVFDPRVVYDPYNNRWLLAAVSNAQTANSSVLVGVSDTSDPQGTYTLFRSVVGCAPGAAGCNAQGEWADFPMLGFNKNWLAVGWNQFTINTSAFVAGKMAVFDYPALRTGTADGSLFTNPSAAHGFCMHPATTLSANEETLYVPVHQQSAGALYRLHTITGTPSSPVFTVGAELTRPGGGWTQPFGDSLPQQCVPGVSLPTQTCPATPRDIEASDAFIRSNVVFRNGRVWYPQSVALPAGGLTANSRFAAQWTALNPDGSFADGGRVEDASATTTNGGRHYSYPSIAVNLNSDVLLGFSEFESDDYVDAAYAFRLGGDAAGTMRDPFVYKEGEDYYQKTFSGTRNRWGDYSHTVVDPSNDRDMWTIQEYAAARVGTTGQGTNDSRWGTWWAKLTATAGEGDLIISEFRVRGPNGANDEFIEIFNNSGASHTVTAADGSAGYAVVASDGVARCTIPNGTTIPARGHYLCVNSVGYSLAAYPAGNGTTATGDATYTTDIPDNAGIAIFNTSVAGSFILANRLDAVGSTSEANTLYKEGTGYPALTPFPIDYSFYRSLCPGNVPIFGSALGCGAGGSGLPKDTDNNASDFVFVDTNGTSAGAGQRLGAPGPENLSSPVERNATITTVVLDASAAASAPPNRVRDFTSDPPNNSTFGTLDIRRRVVNATGAPVTRLRYRVADLTTFPAPSGFADLRPRTSLAVVVSGVNDAATCFPAPTPCTVTAQGTTLEQPPSQPNGGGFNSSMSVGIVALATPLAPGASVNIRFLIGIQQTGNFRFFLNVEALP